MVRTLFITFVVVLILGGAFCPFARADIRYDFEDGPEGWDIPNWAFDQDDHVGRFTEVTS